MMKQFTFPIILIFLFGLFNLQAKTTKESLEKAAVGDKARERLVGNILKNALETYHYRDMNIDDGVSQKAFSEFIKSTDYGKQFLLQSDVNTLKKFEFKMDDQMVSGDHKLLNQTVRLMQKRIKEADVYRKEVFKKKFSFKAKDSFEIDPKKRKFPKSMNEWKTHWNKVYKQSVLNRYLTLLDEQDPKKKGKKDKKTKKKKSKRKEKKLSDKELRKKAHDLVNTKYEKYFARLLKDERTDYLQKFFNSITNIYDPHTSYLPPRKKEDFDIDISGQLEGIGAVLQEDGSFIKVVRIVPGGAAWRQKELEVDDVILAVGEGKKEVVDLVDMRVDNAVRYIRGKKGTEVRLTVKKSDGSRKVIPIIRDVVQVEASYAKSSVLELKGLGMKIGYIHVPKFYRDFGNSEKNCTKDVKEELIRLKKQNVKGVILDLRNNGGGALEDAKQMSGLFIPTGPIVQTKNYTDQVEVLRDQDKSVEYDGPLIVMTNRYSASASEILAGALQDYKRAVIVGGEFSHGKGTVQALLPLNAGPLRSLFGDKLGALKVTIQKFYRINGDSTQYKGVTPDIILPDSLGYSENREKDLDYSLPWDRVKALNYNVWTKHNYDMKALISKSKKRVKKSKRFSKIAKSVDYLVKRRKDTIVSLNLKEVKKENLENERFLERLKLEDEQKDLLVSNVEGSLRSHEKVDLKNEKQWKEDFQQRKEDWTKGLRQDAGIEEALYIMGDMIKQVGSKKISYKKSK